MPRPCLLAACSGAFGMKRLRRSAATLALIAGVALTALAVASGLSLPAVVADDFSKDSPPPLAPHAAPVVESASGMATTTSEIDWEDAILAEEEGAASVRLALPLVARTSFRPSQLPSTVPQLVNGNFDGTDGWTELQNGAPIALIYPNISYPVAPISVPSTPRLAWLGGTIIAGSTVTHQLIQSVTLPAEYDSALLIDYYSQSAEPVCGVDTAAIFVNGVVVDGAFPLCATQSSMAWSERTISLAAFRGEEVTIEFRLFANDSLNSNLYLDNIELCGVHLGLPVARQCQLPGWQEVGGGSARGEGVNTGMRSGRAPSMAISGDGRPWAAWQATIGSTSPDIFVKRWNGSAWEGIGGSATGGGVSNTSTISARPSLAIVPAAASSVGSLYADMPYVAWNEFVNQGPSEIYIKRWNGTTWEEVGAGSASGGGISRNSGESFDASLAIAPEGMPWVAWTDIPAGGGDSEIYIRRFDGVSWVEVGAGSATGGGVSNSSEDSEEPSLAIGSDGSVFVAWTEGSGGEAEIYVKRWNGSAWEAAGAGSASGGGISSNSDSSRTPALAVVNASRAFVAWVDRSGGDTEIYAKQWNGVAWLPAGTNGASGGGISNNTGDSLEVSLNIGRDGAPVAAWTDLSGPGSAEIYVRRWNGANWQEAGLSATLGGVSGTPGASSESSVAVAPDGTPYVMWSNSVGGGSAVYVRRYMAR